jgi:hypothetical protein
LRASWDSAQQQAEAEFLKTFYVIGPFPSPERGSVSLDLPTPVETDFTHRGDGSVDLKRTYDGATNGAPAAPLGWKKVEAKRGHLSLDAAIGRHEWACAYAYTEFESARAGETVLRCGSDDGIRIWLNGELVHQNEIRRAYSPGEDSAAIRLRAGTNRVFVKIDNYVSAWGFGIMIADSGAKGPS